MSGHSTHGHSGHNLSGHIGHLNAHQQQALSVMKNKLSALAEPALVNYASKFCDDGILLRFLRARKFDVNAAFEMLENTLRFRITFQENGVEAITPQSVANEIETGKSFYHKTDKQGRPVCYIRVRFHNPAKTDPLEGQRFTIYMMEYGRTLLTPPNETVTLVFDMTDAGVKNVDLKNLRFMVDMLQNHYPESLGKVLVYNAPWFVHGVWKVVKPWLDPVTAGKVIFVEKKNMHVYISEENLMTEFGGSDHYQYDHKSYFSLMQASLPATDLKPQQ